MPTAPERITALETTVKHLKWLLGLLVVPLIAWGAYITVNVISMRQAIEDGGTTHLVAQLYSPRSSQQLQANLATVSAQAQMAMVEGKRPNRKKVDSLSRALTQVVQKNPELPVAWQAAIHLVNYKFEPGRETASLPNCLNLPVTGEKAFRGNKDGTFHQTSPSEDAQAPIQGAVVVAQNCQLDLDDDGNFNSTQVAKDFRDAKEKHPRTSFFILSVTNAHVVYSGGKLIPINEIRFVNCSFEIKPPSGLPNSQSQSITTQLLAATSPNGSIRLPFHA